VEGAGALRHRGAAFYGNGGRRHAVKVRMTRVLNEGVCSHPCGSGRDGIIRLARDRAAQETQATVRFCPNVNRSRRRHEGVEAVSQNVQRSRTGNGTGE